MLIFYLCCQHAYDSYVALAANGTRGVLRQTFVPKLLTKTNAQPRQSYDE
jgi:hypothetical protein